MRELSNEYSDHGLEILCFPCNQFLSQEPGSAENVEQCSYQPRSPNRVPDKGKKFKYFEKANVNGSETHPVYRFLRRRSSDLSPLGWNFCMFLVDRNGTRIERFGASKHPKQITAEIEEMLNEAAAISASSVA